MEKSPLSTHCINFAYKTCSRASSAFLRFTRALTVTANRAVSMTLSMIPIPEDDISMYSAYLSPTIPYIPKEEVCVGSNLINNTVYAVLYSIVHLALYL